jgi:hypothetical protein
MKHLGSHLAPLAALLFLAGCGSKSGLDTVPIKGEVTYNGKPLADGTVVYLPEQGSSGRQAMAPIQSDGSFSLTTQTANDGVMKGKYQIVIFAYEPQSAEPKTREEIEALVNKGGSERGFVIPEKYTDPEKSGLSDIVDESHSGFKKIELSD